MQQTQAAYNTVQAEPLQKSTVSQYATSPFQAAAVAPVKEAMETEMDHVVSCTHEESGRLEFLWGSPDCWLNGSKSQLNSDFVVRGIYYVQVRSAGVVLNLTIILQIENYLRYFERVRANTLSFYRTTH